MVLGGEKTKSTIFFMYIMKHSENAYMKHSEHAYMIFLLMYPGLFPRKSPLVCSPVSHSLGKKSVTSANINNNGMKMFIHKFQGRQL